MARAEDANFDALVDLHKQKKEKKNSQGIWKDQYCLLLGNTQLAAHSIQVCKMC